MAHHQSGHGGGGGIEGLTPPTGPLTSAAGMGMVLGLFWLIVKHPRVAGSCVIAAALLTFALGSGDGTGVEHSPLLLIAVIALGCTLAGDSGTTKGPKK